MVNAKVVSATEVESRAQEIGLKILKVARPLSPRRGSWLDLDAILKSMMSDERLRTASLRFVDVLPSLTDNFELVSHLEEYFNDIKLPYIHSRIKRWGFKVGHHAVPARIIAGVVRTMTSQMAKRFIAGDQIPSVVRVLEELHQKSMGFTLDLLGEAVVSEGEAQHYQAQYIQLLNRMQPIVGSWAPNHLIDSISGRRAPRLNVSIKASALYSQITAVDPQGCSEIIKIKLRPILQDARQRGAFVTLDMEHYDTKHITLQVLREVLMEPDFRDWPDMGVAMQAYLRDTPDDIAKLITWVKQRGTPIMVRLVRGAYWDFETVHAKQNDWPIPVWVGKSNTDICYEQCLLLLLSNHPHIETAVATHNLRSLAVAIALAEKLKLAPTDYETQMLYGMANEVKHALVQHGVRLRVYVPFGQLIPGMAYLVRRLLENTASQSFLRMGMADIPNPEELFMPPHPTISEVAVKDTTMFHNEPVRRFTDACERQSFSDALLAVRKELGKSYPLLIGGKEQETLDRLISINPAKPEEVVGITASASRSNAMAAITAADNALQKWRSTSIEQRANILHNAAQIMRSLRDELSAWEVYEAGKPWREADADVVEAIDFLDYYAKEAVRMWQGHNLDVPGETNRYFYESRGIGVVIAPWNFPLAILCGMTSAALVTGNTVVMKPAPQTPVIAARFMQIMMQAGVPAGVLNYLPGGDDAGEALVRDPRVAFIAFTGSVAVGTKIMQLAAELSPNQSHFKHVLAELGGKNAIIVDSDADADDAILGTTASAFGFAGQKCSACSRVIVVGDLYETFLNRLVEAAKSMRIGSPLDPGVSIGPVIDKGSYDRIQEMIVRAKDYSRPALLSDTATLGDGYFVGPTVFADVPPDAELAQTEVFGPVLAAIKARDFDHALELANQTRFALTGGVYSRSPAHLAAAGQRFRVGNLYLNRKITGAVVGRQPFGGMKLSGTNAKAGGPDYLLHFVQARHITENTIRRGFTPDN